jgi:hypothetical protein
MTIKTGASTLAGAKRAGTFGTAVAIGATNKLEVASLAFGENAQALRDAPIGSGLDMDSDSIRGATEPSIQINKVARFNDAGKVLTAVLFGADSVGSGTAAWTHSILHEPTRNTSFATVAWEACAGSIIEIPSFTPTKLTYKYEKFPNYLQETIEGIGNTVNYGTSSTNTSATIASATVASTVRTIATSADTFRINLQGAAALSSGDIQPIIAAEVTYEYPVEFPDEMRGTAGNGQPIATGDAPLQATLTVTFRGMDDPQFRMFINSQNNTQYKADLIITSSTNITGTVPYFHQFNFPCLVQVEDPKADLTSTKVNPATIKFKALNIGGGSNGMISGYPHILVRNAQSTSLLT